MKPLLTAALIATALASPVRGGDVTLNCRELGTFSSDLDFRLAVNTETWSATYYTADGLDLGLTTQTLGADEGYVIWAVMFDRPIGAFILHLDRESLRLQLTSISPLDFDWADGGMEKLQQAFQCSSGI